MNIEFIMPTYTFPELAMILMSLVIAFSSIMPGIDRWSRRCFIAFFAVYTLSGVVFAIDTITYMDNEMLPLEQALWLPFIEYQLLPIPVVIVSVYMLHCYGENWRNSGIFKAIIGVWLFYIILHVVAHFTNWFYFSDEEGRFFLKPLHPLLFAPVIVLLFIDLITVVIKRNRLSRRYYYAFLFYLVPSFAAMIFYSLVNYVVVLNIASFIGSFAMYVLIIVEQIEQYTFQKTAIANQNARIMVLKMRPHFIYNTMTSVYYLCEQNPKKAQQVILDFTSYLRKNFNALVVNEMIPFSEELEHIRAYLAVELAQHEDNLVVEYETPHNRFRLPPLTLEPIVENAIKHGLDPDSEPLHILIKTVETDSGSMVIIQDNGPGFDPERVFDSNNALSNIKQRLEMMCKGTITINSKEGVGTTVKVMIP